MALDQSAMLDVLKALKAADVDDGIRSAASARRHRLAGIRVTRNRAAISRSLAPSIHSATARRTPLAPGPLLRGEPITVGYLAAPA